MDKKNEGLANIIIHIHKRCQASFVNLNQSAILVDKKKKPGLCWTEINKK